MPASLPHVCVHLSTLLYPALPLPASAQTLGSQGPKPAAAWCTPDWQAGLSLPLLGDLGSGSASLTWTFVPALPPPPQRMHSRPTTQSSKSTPPPRRLAPPLPAVVSAEPVRSALPARCPAWPRTAQHLALPRVSAIPEERAEVGAEPLQGQGASTPVAGQQGQPAGTSLGGRR